MFLLSYCIVDLLTTDEKRLGFYNQLRPQIWNVSNPGRTRKLNSGIMLTLGSL